MRNRGFVLLIVPIVMSLVGISLIYWYGFRNKEVSPKTEISEANTSSLPTLSSTSTPTARPTVKPTNKPTAKPTTTSSATPTSTSTTDLCSSYNLSGVTGGAEIVIQPGTGYLYDAPYGEIKSNGCKTFDGKSTSTMTTRGYNTGSAWGVTFGSVPPGTYSVRVTSHGGSDYKSITVSTSQLSKVTINIAGGTPAPTSTPAFTPTCTGINPYQSAPLTIQFSGAGSYNTSYSPAGYIWDFTGDGSWDTGASGNAVSYTYPSVGNYTVKMKTVTGSWESSICQTTVTVN